MAATASPFCEHKKLRSSCPVCKATAVPALDPDLRATAYTATHEREERSERRAAAADAPRPVGAAPRQPRTAKPTGPGKPLMPTRRAKQKVSAADEAQAEAWWVKK